MYGDVYRSLICWKDGTCFIVQGSQIGNHLALGGESALLDCVRMWKIVGTSNEKLNALAICLGFRLTRREVLMVSLDCHLGEF